MLALQSAATTSEDTMEPTTVHLCRNEILRTSKNPEFISIVLGGMSMKSTSPGQIVTTPEVFEGLWCFAKRHVDAIASR